MHYQGLTKINDLQTWLSSNNQPDLKALIERQYLNPEKVQNLRDRAKMDIFVDVAMKLNTQKQKFETEQATGICNGVRFKKHTPRQDKIEREIIAEAVCKRRDKTRKNTLLLTWERLAYLDFISTC